MPVKAKKSKKEENISPISKIIFGSVIGSVLYFAALALFAFFSLNNGVDSSVYMPAGIVLGILTAMLGGFLAVRPIRKNGAAFGALTGLIQALICAIALFVANKAVAGTGIFILIAAVIAGGVAGGIIAVNLKIKKRYK